MFQVAVDRPRAEFLQEDIAMLSDYSKYSSLNLRVLETQRENV
jgi:hypothetical protein